MEIVGGITLTDRFGAVPTIITSYRYKIIYIEHVQFKISSGRCAAIHPTITKHASTIHGIAQYGCA